MEGTQGIGKGQVKNIENLTAMELLGRFQNISHIIFCYILTFVEFLDECKVT